MLADAEKRWEVIAIDIDDEKEDEGSKKQSSKKRKVSLSPSQTSSNRPVNDATQTNNNLSTAQDARTTTTKRRWRCDVCRVWWCHSYDECLEHEHTCTAECNNNIVVRFGGPG